MTFRNCRSASSMPAAVQRSVWGAKTRFCLQIGLIKGCERSFRTPQRVSVPAELSLVGFDDSPAARLAAPPLTTVARPHEEKGRH
jgi:Periplasmic binding protein-like domain